MAEYIDVEQDGVIEDWMVQQIISSLKGHAGFGTPLRLTDLNDASNYYIDIKNNDPTSSRAIQALDNAGAVILRANKALLSSDKPVSFGSTLAVTGNVTIGGTLGVTGATTLSSTLAVAGAATLSSTLLVTGAATLSSTLAVAGNVSVNTDKLVITASDGSLNIGPNKFTVAGATGNTVIVGTLGVTGATTLSSTLAVTGNVSVNTDKFRITASDGSLDIGPGKFTVAGASGDLAINTNKFTVAGATGNTLVAGTLDVTGDFKVATSKFTVAAATGNTVVAGTLNVTSDLGIGASKFIVTGSNGNTICAGTLQVTGLITANGGLTVASGSLAVTTGTLTVSSGLATLSGGITVSGGVTLPAGSIETADLAANAVTTIETQQGSSSSTTSSGSFVDLETNSVTVSTGDTIVALFQGSFTTNSGALTGTTRAAFQMTFDGGSAINCGAPTMVPTHDTAAGTAGAGYLEISFHGVWTAASGGSKTVAVQWKSPDGVTLYSNGDRTLSVFVIRK